jgi:hypothetical protein
MYYFPDSLGVGTESKAGASKENSKGKFVALKA